MVRVCGCGGGRSWRHTCKHIVGVMSCHRRQECGLVGPSGPLLLFHALVRVNRSKVLLFKCFRFKNLHGEWRAYPLTSIDVAVDVSWSSSCKMCCTGISCLINKIITTIIIHTNTNSITFILYQIIITRKFLLYWVSAFTDDAKIKLYFLYQSTLRWLLPMLAAVHI